MRRARGEAEGPSGGRAEITMVDGFQMSSGGQINAKFLNWGKDR